ncbi:MAG: DUF4384 domain-containing protein [Betaproteobacteria bacterium]
MVRKLGILLLGGLTLALAACSEEAVKKDAAVATEAVRKGPETAPVRTITNFTASLRCMDNLFLMYGVRDLVVISEDLKDETKKVSAGTKDMLISSVSEMTKRSKAVRLIAYGSDSGNLIGFMKEAEKKTMFQLIPQYGIRGSISQLDESVAKKTEGGGVSVEGFIGVGKASTASTNVLGLDLNMMNTSDLSIVPGVTASNSVVIFRSGSGIEGEAGYKKFGINYQSNLSRAEGQSQALRNLVEMAVVELFGKLTKTPYWLCMGATAKDETVKNEIGDWFQSMFAEPGEFVGYWQQQMRIRGVYTGDVNGEADDGLRDAIMAYREAMGLEKSAKLDVDFFTAYLGANHYEVAPKAKEKLASYRTAAAVEVAKAADPSPIALSVASVKGGNQFKKGERLTIKVTPSRDAYVYCFMQDDTRQIARFFPNRFTKDALVSSKKGIQLPGDKSFNIDVNTKGVQEQIVCFGANRDVFADVVPTIGGGDIDVPTPIKTIPELKSVFEKAVGPSLGVGNFTINVR